MYLFNGVVVVGFRLFVFIIHVGIFRNISKPLLFFSPTVLVAETKKKDVHSTSNNLLAVEKVVTFCR